MATSSGGEKISSISSALKICGRVVSSDILRKAEEAYQLLTSYASETQSKDKFLHSRFLTQAKGSSYKHVSKQQKEAGGVLFDVLHTIKDHYNIDGVWQNYIFLISIYMDRKEYKKKVIQNLYPSDYGGPMELKVHYATPTADHQHKQKKAADHNVQLDPIKYVLHLARSWDVHNQTLQKDLDTARENYETLLESMNRLCNTNREQYEYIKRRHQESRDMGPLSKESDTEKKVASKLFEILKYALTKASKGSERDWALYALQDFHMLVDMHQASLRSVTGSETQRKDLQHLSKEEILPCILEMVKADLGDRLYRTAMTELQELQEKDKEVMADHELRTRRLRWDEMKDEAKVQSLKDMEESNQFQNDVHKALFKAQKENIPGYDKALQYLASLILSETLYDSRDARMVKSPSSVRMSLDFKDESTSTSFLGSPGSDVSSLKQHIGILESELEFQQNQIQDLTTRLSKFATQQLTQGNPNIADLSDRNRPTNIGEKFGQVFDEEWSEAHDALRIYCKSDIGTMETLISIIQSCYSFCQDIALQQQKAMENQLKATIWTPVGKVSGKTVTPLKPAIGADALSTITEKYAREYRKAAGACSVEGVTKLYREQRLMSDVSMVKKHDGENMKKVLNYTDKLIEYTWYMVIQDPPMVLQFIKRGEKISQQQYMFHEKKGTTAEMCVWPALFLYNGGPVVKKGYVLPQ